jgi:hypothetical protein
MAGGGVVEGGDDISSGRDWEGAAGQAQTAVVVDDVEDLDDAPVLQPDVGRIHLPALVGQVRLESDVGALRAFVWLGGDEAAAGEDPPDARHRAGCDAAVTACEVGVDRVRPRISAELAQLLAELHDLVLEGVGDSVRRMLRPP